MKIRILQIRKNYQGMTLYHRGKPPSAVCVQTSTECSDQLLFRYAGIPASAVTSAPQNIQYMSMSLLCIAFAVRDQVVFHPPVLCVCH